MVPQAHVLPSPGGMNIQVLSPLLSAVVTFALGASVLLRDRRRATYTAFAALTLALSSYYLLDFLAGFFANRWLAWAKFFPATLVAAAATRFFRAFLAEPSLGGEKRSLRVTYAGTAVWCLLLLYGGLINPIHERFWFRFPFAVYVFGALYRCHIDLWLQYRKTLTRVEKARLRYLIVGGLLAITMAITDFLPALGVTVPAVGSVLVLLYLYFLSQTLFRYRLLDLNELVGKMVVLASLVAILSIVYGLLLSWVGGGKLEGVFIFNTVVASTVILILFEPVRGVLESAIHRWLVAERGDLRHRMEALRLELMNVIDVRDMVRRVLAALEESRRVTHASVYLLEPDGGGYELIGHLGPRPVDRLDAAARRPLLERARENPVMLEALERELALAEREPAGTREKAVGELDAVARALVELNTALVVGVGVGEPVPALLCLRDERARHAYGLDDLDVFRALTAQMAVVLENSRAYERMKERDRLAALGEMAAGLAHEIRNPLGAIKGAAQLLVGPDGRIRHDEAGAPAEVGEFLGIIVEEVNRLNRVVSQFLDYARPYKVAENAEIDLNDVVKKTLTLLERQEAASQVKIELELDAELPPVRGDPEQLRQVFLNLGINGMQAMGHNGGALTITTRTRRPGRDRAQLVEVIFADTGPGIPRDQLRHLFIPFFTTKDKGTGLGLPISQRIVAHHGGAIEVRSMVGRGTQFSVVLPVAEDTTITSTGTLNRVALGLPPGPSRS
jgi:signal transduction histidine kinase